jgi:hypothetical protein
MKEAKKSIYGPGKEAKFQRLNLMFSGSTSADIGNETSRLPIEPETILHCVTSTHDGLDVRSTGRYPRMSIYSVR